MVDTSSSFCEVCGKSASKRCGGCKGVFYCGVEHQKQHWREHRGQCRQQQQQQQQQQQIKLTQEEGECEEIRSLHAKFTAVIKKYGLDQGTKADDIAKLLTEETMVTDVEFAAKYNTTREEAVDFLKFIQLGVNFKDSYMRQQPPPQ